MEQQNELIQTFLECREYLLENIRQSLEIYITGEWEAMNKFFMLKEAKKLVLQELSYNFPDFPSEYLPQIIIDIDEDEKVLEFSIQNYLNKNTALFYLGSCEHDGIVYDLYHSRVWDLEPWVVSRYGHEDESYFSGSTNAKNEYNLGIMTPLAIAYGMAIEMGCIKQ